MHECNAHICLLYFCNPDTWDITTSQVVGHTSLRPLARSYPQPGLILDLGKQALHGGFRPIEDAIIHVLPDHPGGQKIPRKERFQLGLCNIPGIGVTKIEETGVCIAFMHRKSGEFSRFKVRRLQ